MSLFKHLPLNLATKRSHERFYTHIKGSPVTTVPVEQYLKDKELKDNNTSKK